MDTLVVTGDARWGQSTLGCVYLLGTGAIIWSSKKQEVTALSSMEAEYVAATSSACQEVWLRRVLGELGQEQKEATKLLCDNKATIAIAKIPALHGRMKHIDIILQFIRGLINDGMIALRHCEREERVADILTKAFPFQKLVQFRSMMAVCNFQLRGKC